MVRAEPICNRFRDPDLYVQRIWELGTAGKDWKGVRDHAGEQGREFNNWLSLTFGGAKQAYPSFFTPPYLKWAEGKPISACREKVICQCLNFETIVDLVIFDKGHPVVVEITTGEFMDPCVQFPLLAAKAHAYKEKTRDEGIKEGILLQLRPDGTYNEWRLGPEEMALLWKVFQQQYQMAHVLEIVSNMGETRKVCDGQETCSTHSI